MKQKMLTKKQFDRLDFISLHLLLSGLLICPFSFYFIEISKWIVIFFINIRNFRNNGLIFLRMTGEVLAAGGKAGDKAVMEAEKTSREGGTDLMDVIRLVGFLCDRGLNMGITGRLIHFRDEYGRFALVHREEAYREAGMLRRIKLI